MTHLLSAVRPAPDTATPDADALGAPAAPNRRRWNLIALAAACAMALVVMKLRTGPRSASAFAATSGNVSTAAHSFDALSSVTLEDRQLIQENQAFALDGLPTFDGALSDPKGQNPFDVASAAGVATAASDSDSADRQRMAARHDVQTLQLQSIVAGRGRRACLINQGVYEAGQTVGGFVVEKIDADRVILRRDSFRFELKLPGGNP